MARSLSPPTPQRTIATRETLVPTFGVFWLLLFCFVVLSRKINIGEVAVLGAALSVIVRRAPVRLPPAYGYFLLYVAIGAIGLAFTKYTHTVQREFLDVAKVAIIAVATACLLQTRRDVRTFVLWYLFLFAAFPVRGALYNYLNGINVQGRIAWNFFFENPNDLAVTCLLPLGLCGYVLYCEKSKLIKAAAWIGILLLSGIIILTQSRGAILGLAAGLAYFVLHTKINRVKVLAGFVVVATFLAIAAPSTVWDRVLALAKLAEGNVAAVDPEGSAQGRTRLMLRAVRFAAENPVLGVGLGAFPDENARITIDDPRTDRERGRRDAHTAYGRAAAETGLAGLFGVVMFVFGGIRFVHSARRRLSFTTIGHAQASGLLALELSMISFAFAAIFNSAERSTFFMLQFVLPCLIVRQLLVSTEMDLQQSKEQLGSQPRVESK